MSEELKPYINPCDVERFEKMFPGMPYAVVQPAQRLREENARLRRPLAKD